MRILSATANLLANAKPQFKFLPANLSSTIFHRFTSTTAAPALSPNLKQHDNTNKNLMLMVPLLNVTTCDYCVISMENNSVRVVQDNLPNLSLLRAENYYKEYMNADYIVRACSNYKWMLLTCQKVPGPSYELLWDPTTDETKPLPLSALRPPLPFPIFSFCWGVGVGFDPHPSGDYKVVRSQMFLYQGSDIRIRSEVLSLQTGHWKEIPYPYGLEFKPIENRALHINGFYYWLACHLTKKTYAIVPFDFANEKFPPALIPVPKSEKLGDNVRVVPAEFHGSLAAIVYDFNKKKKKKKKKACFEIWVWGNDDWSWVDEFEVPTNCDALHAIIGLYKNDKVLIQDSNGELLLYDCETRSLKYLGIHDDSFNLRFYPYGKSTVNKGDKLVSLQKDSPHKEKETTEIKSIRPPSQFTQRSPTTDNSEDSNELEKFKKMKLAELKEVAKSNGIKGYSKLKKIELVELLTSNGV
ncbi:F-box protein [Striga asiatica]|uniref:F-box protein n=1 Tax=Striga asiatica TaxID=4170 RepID=A0A5A7NVV5_STRAF|nr:F-box protein [Striga asiatica]